MSLDLTKPVQTRDGRAVRILCTDRKGKYPIIGLMPDRDDGSCEMLISWSGDGHYGGAANYKALDLVNVPQVIEGWVNVYPDAISILHPTRAEADRNASLPRRIACVPFKATEGEGM